MSTVIVHVLHQGTTHTAPAAAVDNRIVQHRSDTLEMLRALVHANLDGGPDLVHVTDRITLLVLLAEHDTAVARRQIGPTP